MQPAGRKVPLRGRAPGASIGWAAGPSARETRDARRGPSCPGNLACPNLCLPHDPARLGGRESSEAWPGVGGVHWARRLSGPCLDAAGRFHTRISWGVEGLGLYLGLKRRGGVVHGVSDPTGSWRGGTVLAGRRSSAGWHETDGLLSREIWSYTVPPSTRWAWHQLRTASSAAKTETAHGKSGTSPSQGKQWL